MFITSLAKRALKAPLASFNIINALALKTFI
jgi:hypothetical protein